MKTYLILLLFFVFIWVQAQQLPFGSCSNEGVGSPLWESEGDVTIGIIANIHTDSIDTEDIKPCSRLSPQEITLVEVVRWLFQNISDADYIPGIKLGKS